MMNERPLLFGPCAAQVGILNAPVAKAGAGDLAVVFINAGLIHHVGPNRLHVQLARALAARGVASLRIDLSGIGDSAPRADHLSIYDLVRVEPREAMDALDGHGFQRYALVGICSGAYSAFHVACEDPRVAAAVMINPEELMVGERAGASDLSEAWARRYWTNSVFRPRAWLNLLSGRVNYRRLLDTLTRQFKASPPAAASDGSGSRDVLQSRMLEAVSARALQLLFLSSGDDVSREYLELVLDRRTRERSSGRIQRHVIEDCDHLFARLEDQRRLIEFLVPWLVKRAGREQAQGLSKPISSKYAMR